MNLLILNTFENKGGAAIATYRLHRGLRSIGINSHLLVQDKKTDDYSVIGPVTQWQKAFAMLRTHFESFAINLFCKRQKAIFSPAWLPERLASKVSKFNPDIVHLFWVTSGFFRIETLKKIAAWLRRTYGVKAGVMKPEVEGALLDLLECPLPGYFE